MANQNDIPLRSKTARVGNKASEGITSQKILIDSVATFWVSCVSRYSQINANNEVSGNDASKAAHTLLRLAISDTATNTAAESPNLSSK